MFLTYRFFFFFCFIFSLLASLLADSYAFFVGHCSLMLFLISRLPFFFSSFRTYRPYYSERHYQLKLMPCILNNAHKHNRQITIISHKIYIHTYSQLKIGLCAPINTCVCVCVCKFCNGQHARCENISRFEFQELNKSEHQNLNDFRVFGYTTRAINLS